MKNEKRIARLQNLGIITLILVSMYYLNLLFHTQITTLFGAINAIILPFGIALFISYLLAPIIVFLEKRFKIKNRYISIAIVFVILLVVLALFGFIIGKIIYAQAEQFFYTDWSNIIAQIETFVAQNATLQGLYDQVQSFFNSDNVAPLFINVVSIVRGVVNVVIAIVLVPVFLVFILNDKHIVFDGVLFFIPKQKQTHFIELGKRTNDVIEKYFNGKFITMFIMSILSVIMLLILGFNLDKAIFFGFTLGFLDIIPYLGGFIAIMLPVLFSFTVPEQMILGEYTFILLIGINLVLQFFQGNILQPYIMGKEVDLHPLLVLSSFIFFGALFGVTGIILAIPITGTIKTSFEYYKEVSHG